MIRQKKYYEPIGKQEFVIDELGLETGKGYDKITVRVEPGGGILLHHHKEITEIFKGVTGKTGMQVGDDFLYLTKGKEIEVPPKTPHRFFNDSAEDALFEVVISPAGSDVLKFLIVLFGLVRDEKTTSNYVPYNLIYAGLLVQWGDAHLSDFKYKIFYPQSKIFSKIGTYFNIDKKLYERYK